MLNLPEREVPAYGNNPTPMLGVLEKADPRDLGRDDLKQLRDAFEDPSGLGLWLFSVHICGLDKLTTHLHWEMCRFLSMWGQPGWRRLMMMVPRGSFKTSLGSKALPLWLATRDPEVTIGIFNAAQDQAKSWIGSIRTILEASKLYHLLWPERLPPGVHHRDRDRGVSIPRTWKWGDSGLVLMRNSLAVSELTFEPYGIGGSSTGRHYSHRIMDDLIGETAANSPVMIEDAIHFVDHARSLERPAHGGCELINCTPWAYRDCYCWGAGARVWMGDGSWKPISQVVVGDSVVGFYPFDKGPPKAHLVGKRGSSQFDTRLCKTRVVAINNRPGELRQHVLSDGAVFECTDNHRFWRGRKCGRKKDRNEYGEIQNLKALHKVMDPIGDCPDVRAAAWLGGMYDADGSYAKNTIVIYQHTKLYPELCEKIRDCLDRLGIEHRFGEITKRYMGRFAIMHRESRLKFLLWCQPMKHRERIVADIWAARRPFRRVEIGHRGVTRLAQVYAIQTETGNYICEGLASKNSHVLTKWPHDYKVYRRSLLENAAGEPDVITGESIFPEMTSTEAAKAMYEADPFVFSSQQQCIPQSGREVSFSKEWVHPVNTVVQQDGTRALRIPAAHFDPTRVHGNVSEERAPDFIPLHWCDRAILIDPAPTKKGEKSNEPRARNGLVVCAEDPWGRRFTLQAVPLREDPVAILDAVVLLAVYWKVHKVGIEEVNFSAVYRPLWTALLRHKHPNLELSFIPLLTGGVDKDTRINSMKGAHREGLWYYNVDQCGYLLQELLEYPNSETRDLIDAQAYWEQALNRPPTPTELEQTWYGNRNSGRDSYTGY